jgi:hypothetical protein
MFNVKDLNLPDLRVGSLRAQARDYLRELMDVEGQIAELQRVAARPAFPGLGPQVRAAFAVQSRRPFSPIVVWLAVRVGACGRPGAGASVVRVRRPEDRPMRHGCRLPATRGVLACQRSERLSFCSHGWSLIIGPVVHGGTPEGRDLPS